MKQIFGKLALFAVSFLLVIPLYADGDLRGEGPVVKDAWIRHAPPVAKVMAGYLVIHNPMDETVVLQGAESSMFKRVEIHRTEMKGEMAAMKRQERVEIPAHGYLEFAPGGLHLMLVGPRRPLSVGEEVEVTLKFGGGKTLPVRLEVRPPGGAEMHHHH